MHIQQSQGYVPRYVLGCWASISGTNVSPHISGLGSPISRVYHGRTSRFIAIVFKAYVDIAFLYSYVEYSQFRASIEVIFLASFIACVPWPFVAVRLRNCRI